MVLAVVGCDAEVPDEQTGFRACSDAQWSLVRDLEEIRDPVACETNDATWAWEDAMVIRVEHDRRCEEVCNIHGCFQDANCPSRITLLADDGDGLTEMTSVSRFTHRQRIGEQLEVALGFDPFDVAGIDLERDAALSIVAHDAGLCLEVSPQAPMSGSYSDCGNSMVDFDLGYADGVLPFDEALEAAQPLTPPGGHWDRSNVAFRANDDEPLRARWSFLVNGEAVEVDMDGNVFRLQ